MQILKKTLYISTPYLSLSLKNSNIVIEGKGSFPLFNFDRIIVIECANATIPLQTFCVENNIDFVFLNKSGKFLFRNNPPLSGSIYLKEEQYKKHTDPITALQYSKFFVLAKTLNQISILEDYSHNHSMSMDIQAVQNVIDTLKHSLTAIQNGESIDEVRGLEGLNSKFYFSVFNEMILQNKEDFKICGRTRRPALDRTNAVLSFIYVLLTNELAGALEAVGLDPRLGFMHTNKSARNSLACDLIEEFRPAYVDRFVLELINKRKLKGSMFRIKESDEVEIKDSAFKVIFTELEKYRHEKIFHPFIEEKIERGLFPYVQAMLLAKSIRGELDGYPPYLI